jgi:integral membrane sensor domain MASE1
MPACGADPVGSCSSTPFSEMSMTWQRSSACVVISSAPAAKATRANWRRSVLMMLSRWLTEVGSVRS